MKKKILFIIILIFIIYILLFPSLAVKAAADGLVLWLERVLPALLPFAVVSNILIYSDYISYITNFLSPLLRLFLPVSNNGAFVVISGFLFGFPIGSKNCAELLKQKKISLSEAEILFVITNNISPVFISSFILCQQLHMPELFFLSLLILYVPALLLGECLLFRRKRKTENNKNTASRPKMNFQIIDAGIMNGFETLTRIGGYIMIFSILISMFVNLPFPELLKTIVIGFLEITNGIHFLAAANLPAELTYVLAMAYTAFGGICGIAQTSSMVKGTGLSMKKYVGFKLILTAVSTVLAFTATRFLF